jgi:hypothetical protein
MGRVTGTRPNPPSPSSQKIVPNRQSLVGGRSPSPAAQLLLDRAQGEYASDVMFRSPEALAEVYPALCRHAMEQFSSPQGAAFPGATH